MEYDVIIVGAGPAGIFTALELTKDRSDYDILIIEKGSSIDHRACPKSKTGKCVKCKNCAITTGFSGAGAFSDGKLSLSPDVGGDLPNLIGYDTAKELIDYTDKIYLSSGADTHVEGVENPQAIADIRKKAIQADLKLVDCPVRHLGTEKAQELYHKIQLELEDRGVKIMFNTECVDIKVTEYGAAGVVIKRENSNPEYIFGSRVIVATGRRGAEWLFNQSKKIKLEHLPGTVDIGVRVECRDEVMEEVNRVLYESKLIGHPAPFKNKVRTFCQNPSGYVAQENYDHNLAVVNGHSYKESKSNNTNFAVLCSHNFSVPFDDPIAYARKVGELTNMLGNGNILVQRFGDILCGKRTWQEELNESNLKPTLPDAVAGDITSAMPYRAMTNIINFIKALDKVVPGIASYETLLYSPELKFYSNKIKMNSDLTTNIKDLYCLGDSSGWTRGLMMASVMGVYMARKILEEDSGDDKLADCPLMDL